MGFLESVGMLAIIAVLFILYIRHISTRDSTPIKPSNIREPEIKKTPQPSENGISYQQKVEAIKKRIIDRYGTLPESVPFNVIKEYSTK